MRLDLKPLVKSTQKQRPYGVADIEAHDWKEHLITGFYCKDSIGEEILEYFYGGKHDVLDFLDFVTSDENPVNEIFCHFGGGYDFLFFLEAAFDKDYYLIDKIIPRGSSLLSFELSRLESTADYEYFNCIDPKLYVRKYEGRWYYKARSIVFRDSGAMLPASLGSLTKSFGVSNKKLDIDYSFKTVTPELITYLESDLKGLYQVIEKYRQWPLIVKAGSASTIAGQAMKIFRTTMTKPLKSLPKNADIFIRRAYFGGRTEIFKPLYYPGGKEAKPIHCFDVNSLYPTVMRDTEFFPGNFKEFTNNYNPDAIGYFEAEVEVPEDMYAPPLATMHKINGSEKLIFPVGRFTGRWSTREIEYARSIGVKIIKIGRGAIFENAGPLFRRYVDLLYEIRQKSPKDSVDNVLAKLLLNSCYGRFGLKLVREKIEFDTGECGLEFMAELKSSEGKTFRLMTQEVEAQNTFTNVGIAGWVAAEGKLLMHKKLLPIAEDVYYMDTDSLFTPQLLEDTRDLGGLKKEYSADSACFLLPKTYCLKSADSIFELKDKNNKVVMGDRKIVMKGFEKRDIGHFTFEDFLAQLEGEPRLRCNTSKRLAKFKTAIRRGNFLSNTEESFKEIRAKYDKRHIIKLANQKYDTRPLCIKNGEII